ncbi:hypothetical protein DINM_000408 [Dirofilaria immitis]|nr:hypothetical protein [Dirofilaria immitis]
MSITGVTNGGVGMTQNNKPIVLYLPNVLQLPIAMLAAFRIGLTVLPISATNEDVDYLHDILKSSGADTVITIDGFWMGTRLIRTKELLDTAIIDTEIRRVLVIRHVSPDKGIPSPQIHLTGRRPYYLYKIVMKQERDSWWSEFFPDASIFANQKQFSANPFHCSYLSGSITFREYIANNTDNANIVLLKNASSSTLLLSISLERLQEEISHVQTGLRLNELSLIISTTNTFHQIAYTLAALKVGAIPLIYEGDIKHPDPSRTSQIIYTYKVAKLLIAEEDLSVLMENKQYITFWDLKTLKEILVLGGNKLCKEAEEIFGVSCRNIEPKPI